MRLIVRLFLLILGLVIAVPFGAATLAVGILADPALRAMAGALGAAGLGAALSDLFAGVAPDETAALGFAAAVGIGLFAVTVAPPALTALIGEVLGLRAFVWYGGAAGALTACLPWAARLRTGAASNAAALPAEGRLTALLFLAGAVSGLGYWLIAGRNAGRPDPRPPYSPPSRPGG